MTYQELRILNAKREDILTKSNFKSNILSAEKFEPIYHFEVKQECNNHGENHMNNVCWTLFDDDNKERCSLWYTQFCGPFYVDDLFIDGTINMADGEKFSIGFLTSTEVKNLLEGRRFKLRFRNINCRFKNAYNLKQIDEKKRLMILIESLCPEERIKYFDYNGQFIDFVEI